MSHSYQGPRIPAILGLIVMLPALGFLGIKAAAPTAFALPQAPQHRSSAQDPSGSIKDVACQKAGPKGCLELALDAMGGRAQLEKIQSLNLETILHTALMEQSYRQAPFITSYERQKVLVDFVGQRIYRQAHLTWPESDPGQSEADFTLVAGIHGGINRSSSDSPCSLSDLQWVRETLALGPARILLTALQASDLHFGQPERIRATLHMTLNFHWEGIPVRIALNPFNHLPDAVDTVEEFYDHWYHWGDVSRRLYFDNWKTFHGLVYPTNEVEERNGAIWKSTQVLNLELNAPIDEAQFKMDTKAAEKSSQSKGWETAFPAGKGADLAPGVTLYEYSWNSTLVKLSDGIVILEAPISTTYTQGLIQEARHRYPNVPVKAVLSTSDSWPHVGGVRQAVALGIPVYILDLNQPLLDRMISAPHTLHPDLLAQAPKAPKWRIVSQKVQVGTGENRMELYPIRGASTERQYMVYFPEHRLLYVSDTLSLDEHNALYDPELMREVVEAVKREGLQVDTTFAMHQGAVPWSQVLALVQKALT